MRNTELASKVTQHCHDFFNNLPKTGKPVACEWTVLSCVVQHTSDDDSLVVVALGTGSKCIGASKMSPQGYILNDSHAEVMARRGFLLYLYDNINNCLDGHPSIFVITDGKCKLKHGLSFIFYSSQLPCGDASIMMNGGENEEVGEVIGTLKRKGHEEISDCPPKEAKLAGDIHRTGAKCLPNSKQDPKLPGSEYHTCGQVRTKPGRGDRTLSVSCSDKLAKWIQLGVQGGLLDMLISEPIYFTFFIFGGGVPYSQDSIHRAFFERDSSTKLSLSVVPEVHQSHLAFPCIRSVERICPAPGSIVWVKSKTSILEVAILGRKLGATKKTKNTPSSALCISKFNLYKMFVTIVMKDVIQTPIPKDKLKEMSYSEAKMKSKRYLEKWTEVKKQFFKNWTVKPNMWNFRSTSI